RLLRQASQTVEELAQVLDLTDNAVRAQLMVLERDGLVQQRGSRRGSSKPAYVYGLTAAAEELFPKAYGPVLRQLLETLNERLAASLLTELVGVPVQEHCDRSEKSRCCFIVPAA